MHNFIHIAQSGGKTYEIPVSVVVQHRASHCHKNNPEEFPTLAAAVTDTMELFKDDSREIQKWCTEHMSWDDVVIHAMMIRYTPPAQHWHEGEWSYHEHNAITGELDGAGVMEAPLEFVAHTMMAARQTCNVTVLNDSNGAAFGAVVVVLGPPPVISAYVGAIQFTADRLTADAAAPATH